MSNVHFLGNKPVEVAQPNDWLVQMLGDMLEKARSGELQTLLGAGQTSDGGIITMFTATAQQHFFYLHLGALEALKLEFVRRYEKE